jgi:hypothetical protein
LGWFKFKQADLLRCLPLVAEIERSTTGRLLTPDQAAVLVDLLCCRGVALPGLGILPLPFNPHGRMPGEHSDDGASAARPPCFAVGSADNAACEEMT